MWLLYRVYPVTNFYQMAAAGVLYFGMYALVCAWTKIVRLDDLRSLFGKQPAA